MASFPHFQKNVAHCLYISLFLLSTGLSAPVRDRPRVCPSGLAYSSPAAALLQRSESDQGEAACTEVPLKAAQGANLTAEEAKLLPLICWNRLQQISNGFIPHMFVTPGIPAGVTCQKELRCDNFQFCTAVCKPGSLSISSWIKDTIKFQVLNIAKSLKKGIDPSLRTLPMRYAQFLGTHNSGITIANGYGIRDAFYTAMLATSCLPGWKPIQTSDQWFTLTDQLNMGVRMIELDVHWIWGYLRIAHCGGGGNPALDAMITTLNSMAKLVGIPTVQWDTGTIGCNPSLNSMGPMNERRLENALLEIKEWFHQEENKEEFLIIYLDSEMDLQYWGKLNLLRQEILSVFPESDILTPGDVKNQGDCPGCATISSFSSMGKRLMFVTRQDFLFSANDILFRRSGTAMYGWSEKPVNNYLELNKCQSTMDGTALRVSTCELTYGLLNCELRLASNGQTLNVRTLPEVMQCGVNFPSPDRLTPQRAESTIWSWAPNEPNMWIPSSMAIVTMAAHDGRWTRKLWNPAVTLKIACRKTNLDGKWGWALASQGYCPEGYSYGIPRHSKENSLLRDLLLSKAVAEVELKGDFDEGQSWAAY